MLSGLAHHLSGLGVEGRIQRQGAVTEILEAVKFGAPQGKGQHRIYAITSLNDRFFVNAKHRRVRGRVQIQADDVSPALFPKSK